MKEKTSSGELVERIVFTESNSEDWKKSQLEDSSISVILQRKEEKKRPSWQKLVSKYETIKAYWSLWDSLIMKDGVLFKKSSESNRKVPQVVKQFGEIL